MATKGLKAGQYILLNWCGPETTYLVKVDQVSAEGIKGRYSSRKGSTGKWASPDDAYTFQWSSIDGFTQATPEDSFDPPTVSVVLNKKYTAVVSADRKTVTVGCQTFPASIVLTLASYLK